MYGRLDGCTTPRAVCHSVISDRIVAWYQPLISWTRSSVLRV